MSRKKSEVRSQKKNTPSLTVWVLTVGGANSECRKPPLPCGPFDFAQGRRGSDSLTTNHYALTTALPDQDDASLGVRDRGGRLPLKLLRCRESERIFLT